MDVTTGPRDVLCATAVGKSYGRLRALDQVDLRIGEGEFVALLGPNGAGKTTLFQILTGLFSGDAGSIQIGGLDLRRSTAAALARIGVVFQQPTLDLDLSVSANLRFHCLLHGIGSREARSRIAEELCRVGLQASARCQVKRLSGGNRRKVEVARALLHRPQLLLMDEATVGLDPASRRGLLAYVRALRANRGMGVLWATHLVDEAEQADRVLILHHGRPMAEGHPADLLRRTGTRDLSEAFHVLTGSEAGEPAEAST